MPNDPLIEAIARAMTDASNTAGGITFYHELAQAALAALKAEGYMLCKWERFSHYDGTETKDGFVNAVAYKAGKGYQLTGLEPPAAALVGRP